MSFNLKEYILFRTEVKRELLNAEVDTNFRMVANPWAEERTYEEGHIVYHPVVISDACNIDAILQESAIEGEDNDIFAILLESAAPTEFGCDIGAILLESATQSDATPTGGNELQSLAWWRAKKRTTRGVFLLDEWDLIGGVSTGDIGVRGADGFGRILINYTGPTGPFQTANDVLLRSPNPDATLNFVAGEGVQLQHDVTSNSIKFINTTAGGQINNGLSLGTGETVYAGMSGLNLSFYAFAATNTSVNNVLSISTNNFTKNIEYNFNSGLINLSELSNGNPTANELSDIIYPTGLPNNGDLLQWNSAQSAFIPIPLVSIGINNIYTASGTITNTTRTVTLDAGTSSNLIFKGLNGGIRIDNTNLGYNRFKIGDTITTSPSNFLEILPKDSNNIQIVLENQISERVAIGIGTKVEKYIFGYDKNTSSFGIITGVFDSGFSTLQGIGVDYLSIASAGRIFIPGLSGPTSSLGIEHYMPFVENDSQSLDAKGKIQRDSGLTWTYDGTNGKSSYAKQFSINIFSQSPRTTTGHKAGLWVANVPNSVSATDDYSIFSRCTQNSSGLNVHATGIYSELKESGFAFKTITLLGHINDSLPITYVAGIDVLSDQITGRDVSYATILNTDIPSTIPQFGLVNFWGPNNLASSKIGIFSDVINTYNNATEINENDETWAGLFHGCVAIKEGGLILADLLDLPECNLVTPTGEISYRDRTLWINNANGHLYRGETDLETRKFKYVIASSNFTVDDATLFPNSVTEPPLVGSFAIGGGYNVGIPELRPPNWNLSDWTKAATVNVTQLPSELSSVDSNLISAAIKIPCSLNPGDKVKLDYMVRIYRSNYGANTARLFPAIFSVSKDAFLQITGNETEVKLLGVDALNATVSNDPVDIFSDSLEVTIGFEDVLAEGDMLMVGFRVGNFNVASTDYMSVSWTLSCGDANS